MFSNVQHFRRGHVLTSIYLLIETDFKETFGCQEVVTPSCLKEVSKLVRKSANSSYYGVLDLIHTH